MSDSLPGRRLVAIIAMAGGCVLGSAAHAGAVPTTPADLPHVRAAPLSPAADPKAQLMGLLPAGFAADNCKPAATAPSGALAEVDCGQNDDAAGPAGGVFWLWANRADMAHGFQAAIGTITLADCSDNSESPGTWQNTSTPDQVAGSVACGNDTKRNQAQLVWTDNSKQLAGVVFGPTVAALNQWWLGAF
jgi:hypothetical protein